MLSETRACAKRFEGELGRVKEADVTLTPPADWQAGDGCASWAAQKLHACVLPGSRSVASFLSFYHISRLSWRMFHGRALRFFI